jgi:prephenate dehydratase
MNMMYPEWKTVAVQGAAGSYGHMAAMGACAGAEPRFFATFEDTFAAVEAGEVDGAAIPIENSTMGRIPDIHRILPTTPLHIVGEYFQPVHHCLLGVPGARLEGVTEAYSQLPALAQCRETLKRMNIRPVAWADTAGAADMVAKEGNPAKAAVASRMAAGVYGLEVLKDPLNDAAHNTTRFVLFGRQAAVPPAGAPVRTSLMFRTRDLPAALYKALGGFATNGINLSKIESYILDGAFETAQFYAECDGRMGTLPMENALEELRFYSHFVRVLGCYAQASVPIKN